ncbi:MAG: ABC transporter permease, partial [Chloroflexi bacterium]|nr:ABC transporter permease [Chloroflexota bacterium]
KILGETLVASPVAVGVVAFALLLGVPLNAERVAALAIGGLVAAFFGGSFGVLVLSNLPSRRAAQNVFPFLMLPQYFLSGIFAPLVDLPLYLEIASRLSPMRYAVDLVRGLFYRGSAEYEKVVLEDPTTVIAIIGAAFVAFMVAGTALFVRRERER